MLERLFPTHSSPVVSAEKAAQAKQVVKPSGPWQWLVATLRQRAWSPYVCGAAIGLLQVPTMLLAGSAIGTSSAFATVASQVRSIFDQSPNVYFAKFALSPKTAWQVALDAGILVGAAASSWFSRDSTHDRCSGVMVSRNRSGKQTLIGNSISSQIWSVVGGAVLVFGARLADGCTSGHGLSGVAQLAVSSFVATATMFAAAMASGTEIDTIQLCACLCLTLT